MKFSIDEIQKLKNIHNIYRIDWGDIERLCETIETQQQEIEELRRERDRLRTFLHIQVVPNKTITMPLRLHEEMEEAAKEENEQLKARVAECREFAQKFIDLYESDPDDETCKTPTLMDFHHKYYCMFSNYISFDVDKDYHNPDDVEVLKLARRVLESSKDKAYYSRLADECGEAIKAIDKAIGGWKSE